VDRSVDVFSSRIPQSYPYHEPRTQAAGVKPTSYPSSLMRLVHGLD
jgi:hypothetical protein